MEVRDLIDEYYIGVILNFNQCFASKFNPRFNKGKDKSNLPTYYQI